ncbi:cupredoxin domain-containing protein [Paenisporosarcina indica]|uniref:cupredoxin domain-containing protein n=1 Tax=Paenisporosarcina indica TaxID=650093 RepID=UPI00094F9C2E|nr:cupredoxin domain-containing protein [Paenisporosarcina indica]
MNKKFLSIIGVLLLSLTLAACGGEEKVKEKETPAGQVEKEDTKNTADETGKIEPTGNVVEVVIKGTNFDFDTKEVKVKAGDTVKLTYENENGAHGVAIDEFGVDIKGGESTEFVVDQKGEFEFYCSLLCGTGHDIMVGSFIAE